MNLSTHEMLILPGGFLLLIPVRAAEIRSQRSDKERCVNAIS